MQKQILNKLWVKVKSRGLRIIVGLMGDLLINFGQMLKESSTEEDNENEEQI